MLRNEQKEQETHEPHDTSHEILESIHRGLEGAKTALEHPKAKSALEHTQEAIKKTVGAIAHESKALPYINAAGISLAGGAAINEVVKSDNKAKETVHQSTLLAGSYVGAELGAAVAAGPCVVTGPVYPLCVGAGALVGSIGGSVGAEGLWKGSEALSKVRKEDVKDGINRLRDGSWGRQHPNDPLGPALARGRIEEEQRHQKWIQQQKLHSAWSYEQYHQRSLNSITPANHIVPNRPTSYTQTSFNHTFPLVRMNYSPPTSLAPSLKFFISYLSNPRICGYMHNSLSVALFCSAINSTALSKSYNNYHPFAPVGSYFGNAQIGGVASEVALIKDLINSEAHAESNEYIICIPKKDHSRFPFSNGELKQIGRELANAYFFQETLPFFSLHFNNDGYLYPIIHPAYQHTLIGKIIGLLDYYMKQYLNGGAYLDEKFLQDWPETLNCNEEYLKQFVKDIKAYCRENCKDVPYFSLREYMSRAGINEDDVSNSSYQQPYKTSFRIIAYQERVERHGNILIPHPTFRVEYSIDLMPDYEAYLKRYHTEHGKYPDNYEKIKQCYVNFAKEIKEKMPKLPFCRDLFEMLGVVNFYCYFYKTLQTMGKMPVLPDAPTVTTYDFPRALPPIPVRYYKFYPMILTLDELFEQMLKTDNAPTCDELLKEMFTRETGYFPDLLAKKIEQGLTALIQTQLAPQLKPGESNIVNEEEIFKYALPIKQTLIKHTHQLKTISQKLVTKILRFISDKTEFNGLTLPDKLQKLTEKLDLLKEIVIERYKAPSWENVCSEILNEFPAPLRSGIKEKFIKIEERLRQEAQEEENKIKEVKAKLPSIDEITRNTRADGQKKIDESVQSMEANLRQQLADAIARKEAHKQAQINSVPAHLRAINQQKINQFISDINNDIAAMRTKVESMIAEGRKEIADDINGQVSQIIQSKTERLQAHNKGLDEDLQAIHDQIPGAIDAAKKAEAALMLHNYLKRQLEHLAPLINHFSTAFKKVDSKPPTIINASKKYLHSTLSFNSDAQHERFKIVGGCGMQLQNLQSEPIYRGDEFAQEIINVCPVASEEFVEANISGKTYSVFKLPVKDLIANFVMDYDETETFADHPTTESEASSSSEIINDNIPLNIAIQTAQIDVIERLLTKDPQVINQRLSDGATPILLAATQGNLEVIKTLLKYSPNLNDRLSNGLFPLYIAIQNNHAEAALLLLEKMDSNALNLTLDNGMTVLHLALDLKLAQVSETLIKKGVRMDLRRKSDGFTTLHVAVKQNLTNIVKSMLAQNISINLALESGKTPLHIATEAGQLEMVKFLISQGADVNAKTLQKDTPLLLAIQNGHIEIASRLAQKAEINAVNEQEQTMSNLAAQYGMMNVADILINLGEDPFKYDKYGYNYFYYVLRSGDFARFIQLVEKHQVNINTQFHGKNLVVIAAGFGHFQIVDWLLQKNAIYQEEIISLPEAAIKVDEVGFLQQYLPSDQELIKKLIFLSAKYGSENCLAILLKQINSTKEISEIIREFIVPAAVIGRQATILERYLPKIDQINFVNADKDSLLHLAVKQGAHHLIPILVKAGIDVTLKNNKNKTAFHLSLELNDIKSLKQLFKLTKPAEWPSDLRAQLNSKSSKEILALLEKYQYPNTSTSVNDDQATTSIKSERHLINEAKRKDAYASLPHYLSQQTEIETLLKLEDFAGVYELVQQNPMLIYAFRSNFGSNLLNCILIKIDTNETHSDEFDEDNNLEYAKLILNFMKQQGFNPADFQGPENVLLTLMGSESDNEACDKLNLFNEIYPGCIAALAQDNFNDKINISQVALARGYVKFFNRIGELSQSKSNTNQADFNILIEAAASDDYDQVATLLNYYSANSSNLQNVTALMYAAGRGNIQMMQLLLAKGADIDAIDNDGDHALHYAIKSEHLNAALFLLPQLKNKNVINRAGMSALTLAAAHGLLPIVKLLCLDADYSQVVDKKGLNALHYAAIAGHSEVIHYLVTHGFNINQIEKPLKTSKAEKSQKRTALHLAALHGNANALITLLQLGADRRQEDISGNTLIEYAVISKNKEIIRIVKELPEFNREETQIRILFAAASSNNTEILAEYILTNAPLTALNKNGHSALHVAAINHSLGAVKLLLEHGLSPHLTDRNGNTALHFAAQTGDVAIVQLLLQSGCDLNTKNKEGKTPLHLAVENDHHGAVISLLKKQANLAIADNSGVTAGQYTLFKHNFALTKKFINAHDESILPERVKTLPSYLQEKIDKDYTDKYSYSVVSSSIAGTSATAFKAR